MLKQTNKTFKLDFPRYYELITPKVLPKNVSMKKRTAYHEAGHAIVGAFHDCEILKISITKNGNTLGNVEFNTTLVGFMAVQISFAGIISEYLYSGCWNEVGGGKDFEDNNHFSPGYNQPGSEIFFEQMLKETNELLNDAGVWRSVEKLAKVLLKKNELYEKEFYELFPEYHPTNLSPQ